MSVDDIFLSIADFFLFTAAALAFLFLVLIQILARWEKSPWGWNVFGTTLFLLLVLTLGVGAAVFGADFPGRQVVRAIVFLGSAAFLVQRIYLLLKVQFTGKWRPFVEDLTLHLGNIKNFFRGKKSTPTEQQKEKTKS